jgi:23S rRNA (adenine2503-C2)-methyltransferase
MVALKSLTYSELETRLCELGLDRWRTDQVVDWVYRKGAQSFDGMTNLSLAQRELLGRTFDLTPLGEVERQVSAGDGTAKFLLLLRDGQSVETVLMPMEGHDTVCISSQVGCRFACKFCLTARRGLVRNLDADEIVQQVLHVRPYGSGRGMNIVFMGMGEPLDNFDAVVRAVRILTAPELATIGARRITVSTTGLPESIRALAALDLRIKLAVSLNAADDALRKRIMPVTARATLDETLDAARDFALRTRHHVTLEYVLLGGVNDALEDAERLRRLGGPDVPFKLNLIPFNPDPRLRFERPDPERVAAFAARLAGAFRSVTVRWSMGLDIDAACGQLFGRRQEGRAA